LTARDLIVMKAVAMDDHKHTGRFDRDNKGSRFPAMSVHPYAISRCQIQERINLCCHQSCSFCGLFPFLYYRVSNRSHRISHVTDCRLFNWCCLEQQGDFISTVAGRHNESIILYPLI